MPDRTPPRPPAAPGLPPPSRSPSRSTRSATGWDRRPLRPRLRADGERAGDDGAVPRHRVRAGGAHPPAGHPRRAPRPALHAALDLLRGGGGLRGLRAAGGELLPAAGLPAGGDRRLPGADAPGDPRSVRRRCSSPAASSGPATPSSMWRSPEGPRSARPSAVDRGGRRRPVRADPRRGLLLRGCRDAPPRGPAARRPEPGES